MHSQLSINDQQKLMNDFQKENEDDNENFKIVIEDFQIMRVEYTMHCA